jgi:hypothetical protein
VTDPGSGHTESFSILGAWDSDPVNGIISYLSPVAQGLLNHRPGEEVEFELEGVRGKYRIDRIELIERGDHTSAPPALAESGPSAEKEPATAESQARQSEGSTNG